MSACNQYIAWLLKMYQSSFLKNSLFFISRKCCFVRFRVCMLYADDACIISRPPQGLAKMMEVIVEVCQALALNVSQKKTETMCVPPPCTL